VTRRRSAARKTRREAGGRDSGSVAPPPLSWAYRAGRALQFAGLMVLPFGIASELVGKVGLGQSLLIAAGGALVFYIGYQLQNASSDERSAGR
jgi:hypothetical protein